MRDPAGAAPSPPADDHERLTPLFLAIVFVEAATIASLYWFSRHFS
jgi:hypothetical protein